MSPLPKPMSQRPTGMPQQRRKSSIRTAAGTAQELFLSRVRALREDPTVVLPECVGAEPSAIARLRAKVERMGAKGPAFLDRFDKGVVGAVARSMPLAGLDSVPRLLDAKIAGQRRFYLVRGHVDRMALLGVQNHDEPRALALAYRGLAKDKDLHFFAGRKLWCTGAVPQPPPAWIEDLAEDTEVELRADADGWTCPHADRSQVVLRLRDGPRLAVCAPCGKRSVHFHRHVAARYIGPNARQPVEVELRMPDGTLREPEREPVARYRAALDDEETLLRPAVAAWRNTSGGRRYLLGETAYASQDAFLTALEVSPWERTALAAMTQEGHVSARTGLANVLDELKPKLELGVAALLPSGAREFIASHRGLAPRDLLRAAHDEAAALAREAVLPKVRPSGPVGAFLDRVARQMRRAGRQAAVVYVRQQVDAHAVPPMHALATILALGGDLGTERRFSADERAAAETVLPLAQAVLAAEGERYPEALRAYLETSGTGETLET